MNTDDFEPMGESVLDLADQYEPEIEGADEAPEAFGKDEVTQLLAEQEQRLRANFDEQLRQVRQPAPQARANEAEPMPDMFSDPEGYARRIREDAVREASAQASQQYSGVIARLAQQSVEANLASRVPEFARPYVKQVLEGLDPVQLASLDDRAYSSIANMAIGQAFQEGKAPTVRRTPQVGEPVGGGRGESISLADGITADDIRGYERQTGRKVDRKWLKENGYAR